MAISPNNLRRIRPRFVRRRRTPESASPVQPSESVQHVATSSVPSYSTQLIPFEVVAWLVKWFARLACIPSFAIGIIGNIGMFGGSVAALYATPLRYVQGHSAIFGASAIYQLIIQLCQIYTARIYGRSSRPYRFFVALSVVPSTWTYGVVLVPWAGSETFWGTMWLIRIPIYILVAITLNSVLWLNDFVQEVILVKEPNS